MVGKKVVFVSATTPLNRADQAASPAAGSALPASTFTDSVPSTALSFKRAVNTSNRSRSEMGPLFAASNKLRSPVQAAQVLVPASTSPPDGRTESTLFALR